MDTWGVRGTVTAVGVAAVVAAIGGAAVYGATSEVTRATGPSFGGPPSHGTNSRDSADVLHAETVVAGGPGGTSTRLSQVGRLTAVTRTSVTVRSTDGFTATYVVPQGVRGSQSVVGDEVRVTAQREGEAAVVESMDPAARPPLSSSG